MEKRRINGLLQSKKGECLKIEFLSALQLGASFPGWTLGHSGPEAQIEFRRLALRDIEFVGARISERCNIEIAQNKGRPTPTIFIENIAWRMTRRALDVIPSYQFA